MNKFIFIVLLPEVETNKTYTVEDYVNYPSCLYWVTEDKLASSLLDIVKSLNVWYSDSSYLTKL